MGRDSGQGTGAGRERLDVLLQERGLAPSRQKAQALILSGVVLVDDRLSDKPGTRVSADAAIRLRGLPMPYVSRGGLKIEHALNTFSLDVSGLRVLDVGISTGGFSDCVLQRGACHVTGIDVGRGQVAWKLRQDERVTLFESTNIRYFDPSALQQPVDLAVVDASFISLTLILPVVMRCLRPGGWLLPLVKPQFEVGKGEVGKKGVVRCPDKRRAAVDRIREFALSLGLHVQGETESPVPGPKGNIEYFLLLRMDAGPGQRGDGGSRSKG